VREFVVGAAVELNAHSPNEEAMMLLPLAFTKILGAIALVWGAGNSHGAVRHDVRMLRYPEFDSVGRLVSGNSDNMVSTGRSRPSRGEYGINIQCPC
jgi:hypothetical protein